MGEKCLTIIVNQLAFTFETIDEDFTLANVPFDVERL